MLSSLAIWPAGLVDPHALVVDGVNRLFIQIGVLQLAGANVLLSMHMPVSKKINFTRVHSEWLGATYQTVDGVHAHVTRHLVAIVGDMPREDHSDIRETVQFVVGALREPEPVRLAAFDEIGLPGSLISGPEIAVSR